VLRVFAVAVHVQAGAAARASQAVAGSQTQDGWTSATAQGAEAAANPVKDPSPKAMACTVVHRANVAAQRPAEGASLLVVGKHVQGPGYIGAVDQL
jgi:hypothetical protein